VNKGSLLDCFYHNLIEGLFPTPEIPAMVVRGMERRAKEVVKKAMYATVRRYEGVSDPSEVTRLGLLEIPALLMPAWPRVSENDIWRKPTFFPRRTLLTSLVDRGKGSFLAKHELPSRNSTYCSCSDLCSMPQ
jgi:hypothetical protein